MRNTVRLGTVTDHDHDSCAVRIVFEDQDNLVSDWLPVVVPQAEGARYVSLPDVGDTVIAVFLGNGIEAGFCLGAIYISAPPGTANQNGVWFPDGSHVYYDRAAGVLTVQAASNVAITAPTVTITGDLDVSGSITRGGVPL